jgi:hypothetical protein
VALAVDVERISFAVVERIPFPVQEVVRFIVVVIYSGGW